MRKSELDRRTWEIELRESQKARPLLGSTRYRFLKCPCDAFRKPYKRNVYISRFTLQSF